MTAIKVKRRNTGGALVPGTAPLNTGAGGIASGEIVYDAVADVFYIGKGDDGSGNSVAISAVGGGGAFVKATEVGAANGVASLDGAGKLPVAQLPSSVVGALNYQGAWNASTNTPALASGTGTKGFYYKVSVSGTTTIDGQSQWNTGDMITFNGTTWDKIDGLASEVISVAGRTGAVTIAAADLTDSGATGRALLQSATPAAAKTALALALADIPGAAPLASPAFTGTPTAPTAALGTNTPQIATMASVQAALAAFAPTGIDGGAI